jgi:hypothetical protein
MFCVNRAAVENNGEDSWCYRTGGSVSVAAVFDGCGGIGGRRYDSFSGKTGAYVAARAVAGMVDIWFEKEDRSVTIESAVKAAVKLCEDNAGTATSLRGSLTKDFPTTAAIVTAALQGGDVDIRCLWAGDSRCYMLDTAGLHQLTRDDVDTKDAMENLSDDGALKNVVNASVPFTLRELSYKASPPCFVFAATDGCFGYLKTPMHFELLLLETLCASGSISQWRENLDKAIGEHAGDDYTLCLMGFGFRDFSAAAKTFSPRLATLKSQFIEGAGTDEQKWSSYKAGYEAYS